MSAQDPTIYTIEYADDFALRGLRFDNLEQAQHIYDTLKAGGLNPTSARPGGPPVSRLSLTKDDIIDLRADACSAADRLAEAYRLVGQAEVQVTELRQKLSDLAQDFD